GEIWLARTVTGAFRAVKIVYRSTFESERAFLREFEGMSAFEPISRGHAGFIDILHVGRTNEYLYYSMELADDHLAGREIDIYSLGKLLYETCTGKDRLDFPEIDSQLSQRPDREQLLQLNNVLVKACANDPKKRYESAAEMHRDLAALERGERPGKSRTKILL